MSYLPDPAPISPDKITSATLTEYFDLTRGNTVFSTAGTTLAATGATIAQVNSALSTRTETLTQTTSANRPTYSRDVGSGRLGALGNESSTYLNRSYTGQVGTMLAIYSLTDIEPANLRGFQSIAHAPAASGAAAAVSYVWSAFRPATTTTPNTPDVAGFGTGRSDGTIDLSYYAPQFGTAIVEGIRTDGVNQEVWRDGRQIIGAALAATGTALATDGAHATLMASISNTGAITNNMGGTLIAFVSFSGRVSDAEWPGLQQWARQLLGKPRNQGAFLGSFFFADGTDESSDSKSLVLVQSDDLINTEIRPSSGICKLLNGTYLPGIRDPHLMSDGTPTIWIAYTGSTFWKLCVCLDQFNISTLTQINSGISGGNPQIWAPDFVCNQDSSMWVDTNGLPRVVAAGSPDSGLDFQPYLFTPSDATWKTGGAWSVGVPLTWTGTPPTDGLDYFLMQTSDGTFHLYYATRTSTTSGGPSTIQHATATNVAGPYTATAGVDPYGLGNHLEGPFVTLRQDGVWVLWVDNQGTGYSYCLGSSITGPWSTPAKVVGPALLEQGRFIRTPPGW